MSPDTPAPASFSHQREPRFAAIAVILIAITLLVMGRLCFNGFTTWDDNQTVWQNRLLDPPTFATLEFYWCHSAMRIYAPLTYTVWAALACVARITPNREGISLDPLVFHGANVLLHMLAALVVCRILLLIRTRWFAALCGSLVFAIHPIQVEAVGWVSGLKDVLSGLLALLALWQYLHFAIEAKGGQPRIMPLVLCIAWLVLAVLAKSTAATVPLAAMALDRWIVHRPWKAVFTTGAWLVIAVLPFIVIARIAQSAGDVAPAPVWQRPIIAADALTFYAAKLAWPAGLGIDYGRTPAAVIHDRSVYWVWVVPCLVGLSLFILRRRAQFLISAASVFVAGCLPTLGLVPFATQFFSTTADHYLYWAMLGPAVAVGWLLNVLPASAALRAGVIAILAAFGLLSFGQGAFWRDGITIFEHALSVNDQSALACSQLAAIALDSGDASDSQEWAARAIGFKPEWALPYVTFGLGAARKVPPDLKMAQAAYEAALARDPQLLPALVDLAGLLAQQFHLDEAQRLCRRAIAISPSDVSAHTNLGNILAAQGNIAAAESEYQSALATSPENAQAQTNWGALLAQSGERAAAMEHLRAALRIDPGYAPAQRLFQQLERQTPTTGAN